MLAHIVSLLRCPLCRAEGGLELLGDQTAGGFIAEGSLRCQSCGRSTTISGGIWDAVGGARVPRTLAQLSNVTAPTPQLYERVWRKRSLSILSGRSFPNSEELAELEGWFAPLPAKSVVVDIGCSEGLYARSVAVNHTVIAVDHSVPFLKRVIKRSGGLPIVAVRAVAQSLPIADHACDAVMIGGTLNEVGDQSAAVNEMGRVCRRGALLFDMSLTSATTRGGSLLQRSLGVTGVKFPSREQTKQMFVNAGFEVERMRADRVVLRVEGRRRED